MSDESDAAGSEWNAACDSHVPGWFGPKRSDFTVAQGDADTHNEKNPGHSAGVMPA